MSKKIYAICMVMLLGIMGLAAGCGSTADKSSGSGSGSDKVIKVGTTADFAPLEFQDEEGKNYQGFDIELIQALAAQMGYKAEIQNMNFDGLIPALESGNVDVAIAGMSINDERKQKVDFSNPYYTSGLTIVTKKDNGSIHGFKDLSGKKIAVQVGTTGAEEAKKISDAQVKEFNNSADTYMELKNGGVDAVVNDRPVNAYYLVKSGDKDVQVLDEILTSEDYGIAVKKGNADLIKKLNDALAVLKQNGEYDKIYAKWFGEKK